MDPKVSKDKKEKKRKNREEEIVEEVVAEVGGDLDDEEIALKKAKKEAKRQRKLEKKNAEPAAEEEVEEAVAEEEVRKEKKAKKEKKSRESSILDDVQEVASKFNASASSGAGKKGSANNYCENPATAAMTSTEVATYREEVGLQVIPDQDAVKYNPMLSFEYLSDSLKKFCPGKCSVQNILFLFKVLHSSRR
jgi:hypothetical protein